MPSPAAFAQALIGLLDDPARARRIGATAAARAAEHTPARYGAAVLDVYAQAAARADRPRSAEWQCRHEWASYR